jgi:hypothetical protein
MNKGLIQSLAKMAHSVALSEYRLRMKTEFAGDVIFADIYDLKFSELIVKECIEWCDAHATIDGSAQQIRDSIKNYFGMETGEEPELSEHTKWSIENFGSPNGA